MTEEYIYSCQAEVESHVQSLGIELLRIDCYCNDFLDIYRIEMWLCDNHMFYVYIKSEIHILDDVWSLYNDYYGGAYGRLDYLIKKWREFV